jgi:hypothetical protein
MLLQTAKPFRPRIAVVDGMAERTPKARAS